MPDPLIGSEHFAGVELVASPSPKVTSLALQDSVRIISPARSAFPNPEIHEFLEADDLDQLLHALGLAFYSLINEAKIRIEAPISA